MKDSDIIGFIAVVVVCIAAVACIYLVTHDTTPRYQPDNNNYNPYVPPVSTPIPTPMPTPTPTPQPKPNVELVDLRGEWSTEKVSTGLLSSETRYHYTITATYYNKGDADAVMELTYSMTYTQNGSERTIEDTQIVQLKAGEVKEFTCTLRNVPNITGTYGCKYKYL